MRQLERRPVGRGGAGKRWIGAVAVALGCAAAIGGAAVIGGCTKARAVSPDEQQAQVAPAKPGAAATVYTVKVPGVG